MKIAILILVIHILSSPVHGSDLKEIVYIEEYAFITCLARVYEIHLGEKHKIVSGLDKEAWIFVEKGNADPDTYNKMYNSLAIEAKKIPLTAVYRACNDWAKKIEIDKLPSSKK